MSNSLFSQSKFIKSIGIGGGISVPHGNWDSGFSIMVQTDFGEVLDYLFFFPFLNYTQAKKTDIKENFSNELTIQYVGGGAKVIGYINSKPRGFYFGGSLSYYYITSESFNPEYISEHSEITHLKTTKVGFGGLAGYLFVLKSVSIFLETDYIYMQDRYNNFSVNAGFNYHL
jgi:hypothetical protein